MVKKQDRRVERTKRDLQLAFLDLLSHDSLHSITIKEIVQNANYNRATFYAHYKDKNSLIDEITSNAISGLINAIREPYDEYLLHNLQKYPASSVKIFDYVKDNEDMYRMLFNPSKFPGFQEQLGHSWVNIILNEAYFINTSFDKFNKDIFIEMEVYALLGMLRYWINNNFNHSSKYMAEQMVLRWKFKPGLMKFKVNDDINK